MKNLFNSRGSAILLTFPLLVVILVAVQISLTRAISFRKTINHFRHVGTRDALVANINNYASLGPSFRSSLHASLPSGTNPELQNCVFGTGPSPCPAGVEMPLTLYAPVSAASSSTPILKIISGPIPQPGGTSKPALYNANGSLCPLTSDTASPQCPFEVYTSFTATCAGGAASCPQAESISVRYLIRNPTTNSSSGPLLATVTKQAPSILVSKILPGPDDTSTNVVISSFTTDVLGTETTTTETTTPTLSPIAEAVKKGAEGTFPLTLEEINYIAERFTRAGYTEAHLDFIEKITKHSLPLHDVYCTTHLVLELGKAKITDINDAKFLVEVGIEDDEWMQLVLESEVQNSYMARSIYHFETITDAQTLATVVEAVSGLPDKWLVAAIASRKVTTKEEAEAIYQIVNAIPSARVSYGVVKGDWYKDLGKMNAIVKALEGVSSGEAEAMAQIGITDATLAQKFKELVSSIKDDDDREKIILDGQGDLAKTETLVANFLEKYPTGDSSPTTTLAESTITTTNTASTSTTTTTKTTTTTSSTTPPPENPSLISTCTNCSTFTY